MTTPPGLACLRCKSVSLIALPSPGSTPFFECPNCRRQFALHSGNALTFRWGHPISKALYPVIFDAEPAARAGDVARALASQNATEWLANLVSEIVLELDDPTQDLAAMLDCQASDAALRTFLRAVAEQLERVVGVPRDIEHVATPIPAEFHDPGKSQPP